MSQEFNFDIDKIANNAISKSDKTTEIIEANTTQENGQLTFLEKLTPEQQSAITAKAPQLVDNFVSDQNALLDFGQSAVEEVNGTVNRILAEQKKLQIPQVDELLKNTNKLFIVVINMMILINIRKLVLVNPIKLKIRLGVLKILTKSTRQSVII